LPRSLAESIDYQVVNDVSNDLLHHYSESGEPKMIVNLLRFDQDYQHCAQQEHYLDTFKDHVNKKIDLRFLVGVLDLPEPKFWGNH
jgi:hypothetical protein